MSVHLIVSVISVISDNLRIVNLDHIKKALIHLKKRIKEAETETALKTLVLMLMTTCRIEKQNLMSALLYIEVYNALILLHLCSRVVLLIYRHLNESQHDVLIFFPGCLFFSAGLRVGPGDRQKVYVCESACEVYEQRERPQ